MGSSNSGSDTSRPLTGKERSDIFQYGMRDILGAEKNSAFDINYQSPQYISGGYQQMSDGDYNALQQSLYQGATAGLGQYEQEARQGIDQSLSDRGIWSSGVAQAAQNDLTDSLADTYAQAGANATAQALAMKQQDLQGLNAYNMNDSAAQNQFNLQNAGQDYMAQWAPLEYLQGLYNGTGGTISKSSSSGWGIL